MQWVAGCADYKTCVGGSKNSWWLPRCVERACVEVGVHCASCSSAAGGQVTKLRLSLSLRGAHAAPVGCSPEEVVCPICDDFWER